MAEVYICDTEFEQVKDTYTPHTDTVEDYLAQYCQILESIVSGKTLQGKAADNLLAFMELVRNATQGELAGTMQPHGTATGNFLENLFADDEANL